MRAVLSALPVPPDFRFPGFPASSAPRFPDSPTFRLTSPLALSVPSGFPVPGHPVSQLPPGSRFPPDFRFPATRFPSFLGTQIPRLPDFPAHQPLALSAPSGFPASSGFPAPTFPVSLTPRLRGSLAFLLSGFLPAFSPFLPSLSLSLACSADGHCIEFSMQIHIPGVW